MSWAQRLKRLFQIDIERCSKCGGNLRVIACIENSQSIAQILTRARSSEAATAKVVACGPPREAISPSSPHLNSLIFLLLYNTYPVRYGLNHSALANAWAKEQFCCPNAVIREA